MHLDLEIPDDLAGRFRCFWHQSRAPRSGSFRAGGVQSRAHLEGRVAPFLGFGTRYRLDGFLKEHDVFKKYTMADFEQEREDLRRLGF